jgi:hypothetical protein
LPKGWKKHPITGELVKAFIKVPPPVPVTINYNDLLSEYYVNIKNGVLINLKTFVNSKTLSDGQKQYFLHEFIKTNHPDFWEKVLTLSRQHYQSNSVEVDAALIKKCMAGDPRAIELYYKRIENWNPQQSQPVMEVKITLTQGMLSGGQIDDNVIEIKQTTKKDENLQIEDKNDETL